MGGSGLQRLITTEIGSDYYVQGQEEAYCQQVQAPHAIGTCREIIFQDALYTGSGNQTDPVSGECADNCPTDGRATIQTARWAYSIKAAQGGVCSSNVDSAYQVWGVDTYDQTQWTFPDGIMWTLNGDGANDGWGESSGHYFICP